MVNTDTSNYKTVIPPWASCILSSEDLKVIETAVHSAERTTSGEIVPILVKSSGSDQLVRWLLILSWFALVFSVTPMFLPFAYVNHQLLIECVLFLMGAGLVWILPVGGWLYRYVLPKQELSFRAEIRAELEFYRSRIQSTAGKTGILLFVSLYEHRAVVLADQGISRRLPPETWNELLAMLLEGFKRKQVGPAYAAAIKRCGEILAAHFPIESNDRNELCNSIIIKE